MQELSQVEPGSITDELSNKVVGYLTAGWVNRNPFHPKDGLLVLSLDSMLSAHFFQGKITNSFHSYCTTHTHKYQVSNHKQHGFCHCINAGDHGRNKVL